MKLLPKPSLFLNTGQGRWVSKELVCRYCKVSLLSENCGWQMRLLSASDNCTACLYLGVADGNRSKTTNYNFDSSLLRRRISLECLNERLSFLKAGTNANSS